MLGHVLSSVRFLPRHSLFADCKLYIRTHLLASAFSNFWKKKNSLVLSFFVPNDDVFKEMFEGRERGGGGFCILC